MGISQCLYKLSITALKINRIVIVIINKAIFNLTNHYNCMPYSCTNTAIYNCMPYWGIKKQIKCRKKIKPFINKYKQKLLHTNVGYKYSYTYFYKRWKNHVIRNTNTLSESLCKHLKIYIGQWPTFLL